VYIADRDNNRIRRLDGATGVLTTVAGNGNCEMTGDGGAASAAGLVPAGGDGAGRAGELAEGRGHGEPPDPAGGSRDGGDHDGGGDGSYACSAAAGRLGGDGGGVCYPDSLALDGQGALLIADSNFQRVRRVEPGADGAIGAGADAANETIGTVAGNGRAPWRGTEVRRRRRRCASRSGWASGRRGRCTSRTRARTALGGWRRGRTEW